MAKDEALGSFIQNHHMQGLGCMFLLIFVLSAYVLFFYFFFVSYLATG